MDGEDTIDIQEEAEKIDHGIEEETERFKQYIINTVGNSEGTANMYAAYIKRLPHPLNFNQHEASYIKRILTDPEVCTTTEVRSAFKKYLKYLKHRYDYSEQTSRDLSWVKNELSSLDLNRNSELNKSEVMRKYLRQPEIESIIHYVNNEMSKKDFQGNQRLYDEFRIMPLLMFETGCRVSELIGKQYDQENTGLRTSDIDFEDNRVIIRKAKRGKQRKVDFSQSEPWLHQLIQEYSIQGKVFTIPYWKARDELAKVGAELFDELVGPYTSLGEDQQRLTSHWFRHSFATNWVIERVEEGNSWAEAKELVHNYLDHDDKKTTEAYIKAAQEINRENIYDEYGSFDIEVIDSE